jgi:hypothetical protein
MATPTTKTSTKTVTKRISKSKRIHARRVKQIARKAGNAQS